MDRRSRRAVLAALTATAVFGFATPAAATINLGDGGWCWFADPRAIHHHGNTYVGWVAPDGDIMVAKYDHATSQTVTQTLHDELEVDDHANPALQILPDGRLAVYYSRHAGDQLMYRIASHPSRIDMWSPEYTVPVGNTRGIFGYTYPNPVHLDAEHATYLFWRGGDGQPVFSVLPDDRSGWRPLQQAIASSGGRPYVKYASDGHDTVHMAFTNAHPDEYGNVNIYYARLRNGRYSRADGTQIGTIAAPITPADASLVWDRPADAWVHDIALTPDGRPVIVFATVPGILGHEYRYAIWTGTSWRVSLVSWAGGSIHTGDRAEEPSYSGGITIDQDTPRRVYFSRQTSASTWQVATMTTPDEGQTWTPPTVISPPQVKAVRPFSPRNLDDRAGLRVIWMEGDYRTYMDYDTHVVGLPQLPPSVTPAQPPAQVAAPDATSAPPTKVVKHQTRCRLWRATVRTRGVSCQRARHVLRRYIRTGRAARGWRCRQGRRVTCKRRQTRISVSAARTPRH